MKPVSGFREGFALAQDFVLGCHLAKCPVLLLNRQAAIGKVYVATENLQRGAVEDDVVHVDIQVICSFNFHKAYAEQTLAEHAIWPDEPFPLCLELLVAQVLY